MPKSQICAVVVTYHPPLEDLENLAKVRPQVDGLVVVDNCSSPETLALLRQASRDLDFTLVESSENHGIGAALNTGVRWAQSNEYEYVIFFDQDSTVTEGFIETMKRAFLSHPRREKLGVLVPTYVDKRSGIALKPKHIDGEYLEVAMTSGSMMPVAIFSEQGIFEESLFIGGVDYEYCFRIRSNGYLVKECQEAMLLHAPATPKQYKLFGKYLFASSNYSSLRRYYTERNRVWIGRRYWKEHPRFVRENCLGSLKEVIKIVFCEADKWKKLYYTGLGIRDGFIGRMGKTIQI
jgi:rhamnosyltransferase